jgi:hypothetical protein
MSRRHVGNRVAPELTGVAATTAAWVPHELLERSKDRDGAAARTLLMSASPAGGRRAAPAAFAWGREERALGDGRHHSTGGPTP